MGDPFMDRYHYLGHAPLAGAQMRYLIRCQSAVLGGMGLGASAWSVAVRDRLIGWSPEQRQKQLHLIVNHSRFLLFPWAGSPNLASCVLALVSRQLPNQWQARYGYRPVSLESFVEKDRFEGTCYKAANWRCLGLTSAPTTMGFYLSPVFGLYCPTQPLASTSAGSTTPSTSLPKRERKKRCANRWKICGC